MKRELRRRCWGGGLLLLYVPLVEVHAHGVVVLDLAVESALHEAVRAQGLLDVSTASVLGPQLYRREPSHVVWRAQRTISAARTTIRAKKSEE